RQPAGMEPRRPVGGGPMVYRFDLRLDYENLVGKLMARAPGDGDPRGQGQGGDLAERLQREEFEARLRELRDLVEAEVRRRLVGDRGVEAMARTLRKPLPEDVDFMHASREEMQALQRAIYPLTRPLAAPPARGAPR